MVQHDLFNSHEECNNVLNILLLLLEIRVFLYAVKGPFILGVNKDSIVLCPLTPTSHLGCKPIYHEDFILC